MKISKIILSAFLAICLFASCDKDNDDNKTYPIEGRWVGTYVNSASGNTFYYSFNIKAGGVIEEINSLNEKVGEGTWQLDPATHVFSAHYAWPSGLDFSVLAAFDEHAGKMVGDWGYDDSATDGGTWQMTKSN